MLSPGETRPGEDRREDADTLFRAMSRMVPHSGIQFLDLVIPRAAIDGVVRHFGETRVELGGESVWALTPALAGTDAATIRIDGRTAVGAVLGQWLPLPFLRFIARDGTGRARFDEGPYNWARLYIAASEDDADTRGHRAVIAFDTRIEPASRVDLDAYLVPTADDVQFASTFALTDDATELAPYLAEGWVQDWIEAVFPRRVHGPSTSAARAPLTSGLHQIAGYLTLLSVLRRSGVLPSMQYFDTRPHVVAPVAVDVVLDVGTDRSAAMLVSSPDGRPDLASSKLVLLRDLTDPTRSYRGAFDSRIAFARPTFGNEALSRKSGRPDAFHWPSLARTGPEARRISSQSQATDGAIGIASPKAHLTDLAVRDDTWRFAADPSGRVRRAPMITGRLLSQTAPAAGLLTGPVGAVKQVVMRPRYSLSSMTSFLIAEVVLQALSSINAPSLGSGPDGADDRVRQIRQIILPVPLTMPRDERDLLRERAEAAIDMLWRALDWDVAGEGMPPKPVVRLGLDETLAVQLVYLYDEIAHRFGGDSRSFLDVMGKSRPEFGIQPCLRLGAIDVGGGHTTMTIVTYASSPEAPIAPKLLGAQRSRIAGGAMLDQVAATLLLPTLAKAVAAQGGERPLPFIESLLAPQAAGAPFEPMAVGQRLSEHWLRPAALTLVKLATGTTAHGRSQALTLTLGELAGAGSALNLAVVDEFAVAIEAIRAAPVDLAAVAVTVKCEDIQAAVRAALEPMIGSLSRALVVSDCDVVVLTGWGARIDAVRDLLVEHMPWRPDRIRVLSGHAWQAWYPMSQVDRVAADGKDIALVGSLLALAGGERLGFGGDGEGGFGFGSSGVGGGAAVADGWQAATEREGAS